MKRTYPVVDMVKTGQNIKRIMQARGLTVKDIQEFIIGSLQLLRIVFKINFESSFSGSKKKYCFMYLITFPNLNL